ncbi:DUF421 domain-containing protein [Corynebacterium mendelii]|uniref:DUF421 domain-containing protein n=1 Tax=Corynebacterium mendelii TaxID=2765362 RepID=A0A939E1B0_9CORY|nr:YetF domain-containing protein [Corynebacterium mendelii]MBN9644609.1 DUF421 domain-containing protein [Corynebacterium mendelii]
MWYSGLDPLIRIVLVGSASYVTLLIMLRISGARSLAKFNAFDFAVTVAVGSMLASAVTSTDLAYVSGVVAIAMMLVLQYVVAKVIRTNHTARNLVTATPIVLVKDGRLIEEGLKRSRLGKADVNQAARQAGHGSFESIGAMILETDGTMSTIAKDSMGNADALDDLDTGSWTVAEGPQRT